MYRVSLAGVPTEQEEAYLQGAKNLWRFHHKDARELLEVVAWIVGLILLASLIGWGLHAWLAPAQFNPCGTIGCHHPTGTLPPYHGPGSTIPPFKP